mmetsp:Transcript_9592/g.19619  ORF Transcript_9592/g.19619 Transcript_9592/m.19619 type:complete len:542 (-) Transcript_9592:3758-5383(-)
MMSFASGGSAPFGMQVLPHILKDEASEEKGENARLSSFVGALAITDLIKTTLGPKGMDKILQSQSGSIMVTNDGATILKSLHIDNAAAKVLVEISKAQDDEVGDGTTSVCCLAGELLREAEKLLERHIHPQLVVAGYREAAKEAQIALENSAIDNSADPQTFHRDLMNIARTTLSSKLLSSAREAFAKIAVDAVLRLKGSTNLDNIQIIKKAGGSLNDSWLEEGFILEKKLGVGQPKRMQDCKILVANTAMDTDKIKIYGARVRVESITRVAEIEEAEKSKMMEKCEKILKHKCNVFVNRQLIYNRPEQFFADHGVMAIEHADFEGVERIALVTGADIVSTFDDPESVKLGHCDVIEEIIIGEDRVIRFSGCAAGEACTIVLRGANQQVLDEAERSLHDALCVLSQTVKETKVTFGGGCAETLMAHSVDILAARTPGKKALAVEAYARALRALPNIIADNGGLDASDLVARLRAAHAEGNSTAGLDMIQGTIGDMKELGVTEPLKLKRHMIISATEAAEMIIRVDDIIKSAPRKREAEPGH